MTDRLLTAREVGERLSVSERYVWRLAREDKLPSIHIGKYIRFDPADVAAFVEASRSSGTRRSPVVLVTEAPPRTASASIRRRRF
jgi:excisionase family DNA binding protein